MMRALARALRSVKLEAPREKLFFAVADPVGPAKPHQTEGTCSDQASQAALRGPKKRIESDGGDPAKADSALPSHLLRIMEMARLSNARLQRQALCFGPVRYCLGMRGLSEMTPPLAPVAA